MNTFYLRVFPGLEDVVGHEIRQLTGSSPSAYLKLRNFSLVLTSTDQAMALMRSRTSEDVYIMTGRMKLSGQLLDLAAVAKHRAVGTGLKRAMGLYAQLVKAVPARPQFRVVVQADDASWRDWRRVDLQNVVEQTLVRTQPGWRLRREEAPIEVWVHQVEGELLFGLRLTSHDHRSRGGREVEREAALRPTIAAAMVQLTNPVDTDVFADVMCGSGTILLERAQVGRYALLVGGDCDPSAVEATLSNFGARHRPHNIAQWDAQQLPLDSASIDKLATNLPWGRKVGTGLDLATLYRKALAEMVRVVRPGGQIVLLSSEWNTLKGLIKHQPGVRLVGSVANIKVLGRRADIFALQRLPG